MSIHPLRMRRLLAGVAVLALLGVALSSPGADNRQVIPAGGNGLHKFFNAYWAWAFVGVEDATLGAITFLPLPQGVPDGGAGTFADPVTFTGEIEVTVKANTPIVLPLAAWLGEVYVDGSQDLAFPDEDFGTYIDADVTLNGEPLEWRYVTGSYNKPVLYDEPSSYGSVGLAFQQSIGVVLQLKPGDYTLVNHAWFAYPPGTNPYFMADGYGVIYQNTWTIHVEK